MPFNKAFRERQRALRGQRGKIPRAKTPPIVSGISAGATFPEKDIHCEGMTIHLKGKVDKYGNWIRE